MEELPKLQKAPPGKGRKKIRNVSAWKKTKAKLACNKPKKQPKMPTCAHNSGSYKCGSLSTRDINHFHHLVYRTSIKIEQDKNVLKYCTAKLPSRDRQKKEGSSRKGITISYRVKKATLVPGQPNYIPVCQATFLGIVGFSKTRVQNLCKKHYLKNEELVEKRGGDTRSRQYGGKRRAIDLFMQVLVPLEKHYCRGKSYRAYFPSDLNLNKLWRMYNESADGTLHVKKQFFRNYVNLTYNIGFGQPASDVCSFCLRTTSLLKNSKTEADKMSLMIKKRIHQIKYKAFFQVLKTHEDNVIMISYDCQKNLVLPKVPDTSAYYSRQLYKYNFTIVTGTSKDPLTKENVNIYTWNESDHAKGANEISSAVYHRLKSLDIKNNITCIRLVADDCGGQNKNSIMVGMASKWLAAEAPAHLERLEFYFPVTGHSFLPADRVFAKIEKEVPKKSEIINPSDYDKIFNNHGSIIELGDKDCPVLDWKTAVNEVILKPGSWHFKFKPSKRIILKPNRSQNSISVRGETTYRNDMCNFRKFVKKGKSIHEIQPAEIRKASNIVKAAKLSDVQKLISSHFGESWEELPALTYYKEVMRRRLGENEQDEGDEDQPECEGSTDTDEENGE